MPSKKGPASDDEIQQSSFCDYKRNLGSQKQEPLLKLPDDECKKYTIKKPYPQNFSIPENILFYMAKNPINPHCHQKFIKTCKYVFRHSSIIPVENVNHHWPNKAFVLFMNESASKKKITITFEKIPSFKLWMHYHLNIYMTNFSNLASLLTKNIYQCSLELLCLCDQILTFNELQILTGGDKLHKINFYTNIVKNGDGSITDFEKVFEVLLCEDLHIWFHFEQHGIGRNTVKRIAEILESQKNSYFIEINHIPQLFDFHSFSEFLKANTVNRKHTIDLRFRDIASDEYKNQLQQFVNEIIQNRDIRGSAIPIVQFHGQNETAYNQLRNMRNRKI